MTDYLCHTAIWSVLWFIFGFALGYLARHLGTKDRT